MNLGKPGYYLSIERSGNYLCKTRDSLGRILSDAQAEQVLKEFETEIVNENSFSTEYKLIQKRV